MTPEEMNFVRFLRVNRGLRWMEIHNAIHEFVEPEFFTYGNWIEDTILHFNGVSGEDVWNSATHNYEVSEIGDPEDGH